MTMGRNCAIIKRGSSERNKNLRISGVHMLDVGRFETVFDVSRAT